MLIFKNFIYNNYFKTYTIIILKYVKVRRIYVIYGAKIILPSLSKVMLRPTIKIFIKMTVSK